MRKNSKGEKRQEYAQRMWFLVSQETIRNLQICLMEEIELPEADLSNLLPKGSIDLSGTFRKRFI